MQTDKISTKELAKAGALLAIISLSFLFITGAFYQTEALAARPNVVFIMTDDLDSATLQKMIDLDMMPNLEQYIIAPGTTFTESFVVNARGCPARTALFTGRYFHNTVTDPYKRCSVYLFDDASTLATWLDNAGYATSLIGRYMDGYGYTDINHDGALNNQDWLYKPVGWDNWEAFIFPAKNWTPTPGTVVTWWENANMYNYNMNDNGTLVSYDASSPDNYQVDVIANRAEEYINSRAGLIEPFFLLLSATAPHVESIPDGTLIDEYTDAWRWDTTPAPRHEGSVNLPLPTPPSFNEEDVTDKPAWVQLRPSLTATEDVPNATNQYNNRLAALRSVDDMVGKVALALSNIGELENTVLIFTSDNGWFYGEHRLSSKLAAYEESIRVPLYIKIPGQTPNTVSALVTNIDLPATIADWADAAPTVTLDGSSLMPLINQPTTPWRKRILIESWRVSGETNPGLFDVPTYNAVRTGASTSNVPSQTYVEYEDGALELYDLSQDPWQLTSLHLDPEYSQSRRIHSQWLSKLKGCGNGSCRQLEFR